MYSPTEPPGAKNVPASPKKWANKADRLTRHSTRPEARMENDWVSMRVNSTRPQEAKQSTSSQAA